MRVAFVVLLAFVMSFGQTAKRSDITTLCGPTSDSTVIWLSAAICEVAFGKEAVEQAKAKGDLNFKHNRGKRTLFTYDKERNYFLVRMNFFSDTLSDTSSIAKVIDSTKVEKVKKVEDELVWDPVAKKLVEVH